MAGTRPAGTVLQRQLSELLYAELLHTFGSYRMASERFETMVEGLGAPTDRDTLPLERAMAGAASAALGCNRKLRDHLHRPQRPDPQGSGTPRRPSPFDAETRWAGPNEELIAAIGDTYLDVGTALAVYRDTLEGNGEGAPEGNGEGAPPANDARLEVGAAETLGQRLGYIDEQLRRIGSKPNYSPRAQMVSGQVDRTWVRREQALRLLESPVPVASPGPKPPLTDRRVRGIEAILGAWIGSESRLLPTLLEAMSEAHMWMHHAEHWQSKSFGRMFTTIPDVHTEVQKALRYSLVLNTFAFVVARSAPWIFAEDDEERRYVLSNLADCRRMLAPTYCMWLSTQVALLALHRRAFSWWAIGRHSRAYRDFHKLARILRGLRRPAEDRALRVPGTKTFIDGMTAMSELHIGRIYRGQHAYRKALRHFKRASSHLRGWEKEGEVGEIMRGSHWRVNLLLNRAKAHYELGAVTKSILFYARAWRAFLLLVESETKAKANVEVVMNFIEWMSVAVEEPELSRGELRDRLEPLVEQFGTLRSPKHLRLLAADIVSRMGHLLRVLNLPPPAGSGNRRATDHTLARKCIEQAVFLDPTSTLVASDYLKLVDDADEGSGRIRYSPQSLEAQWPSGSSHFEAAARVTEHTLQRWLRKEGGGETLDPRARIARDLLTFYLAHTDSSNVKLAQVYRYLMRKPRDENPEIVERTDSLELICLRRYSSFFPFLPRPSAFGSPGGGYLVRLYEPGGNAFGIAIDPGPDFVENLYRCGYSLADIQMIVISHDHADHITSLDALLALLYQHNSLGEKNFDRERRLLLIGNESVCQRYAFYNEEEHPTLREDDGSPAKRRDSVSVMTFREVREATEKPRDDLRRWARSKRVRLGPESLRIEPVRTYRHTDAAGSVAQGFLLGFGDGEEGGTILFAGDTGMPPTEGAEENLFARGGGMELVDAVAEADVVVAHISSVPLPELRRLAGLEESGSPEVTEYQDLWREAARTATRSSSDPLEKEGIKLTEFLLKQLQFGFRSRADDGADLEVSPFSPLSRIKPEPPQHLYLSGLIEIAEVMRAASRTEDGGGGRERLLVIGELREELGTFRTRIARGIAAHCFGGGGDGVRRHGSPAALTGDIGLRVRLGAVAPGERSRLSVQCTTCDLDNDLLPSERFHPPVEMEEVCVKGEDEGVFYNCGIHDPQRPDDRLWIEAVERYDPFAG